MDKTSAAAWRGGFDVVERVLLVAACTMCIAVTYAFGLYLFATLAPAIRADIGFGDDVTGYLTAAGMAGFLIFSLLSGWLRNRIGADWLTFGTLLVCAAALAGQIVADDVWSLGALRFALGACTATIWAPMVEIVPRFTPPRYQGRALGLISSGTNLGLMLNGALIAIFLGDGDWRAVWAATAVAAAALAALWAVALFASRRVAARASAAAQEPQDAGDARSSAAPSTAAARQFRAKISALMAVAAVGAFVGMPATSFLASYATDDLGLDPGWSAAAWSLMGAIGVVSGVGLGAASDRFGYRVALGLALGCLCATALGFVWAVASPATPLLIAAGLAIGFFPIYGLIPSYIAKIAPKDLATRTFGYVNVALGVTGMVGNALCGWMRDATGAHAPFFGVVAALALGALLLISRLPEPAHEAAAAEQDPPRPPQPSSGAQTSARYAP